MSTPSLGHKFRFKAIGAAVAYPVTRAQLLNLIQVATSATTSARVIGAARLKRVRVWSPIDVTAFAPQTISVEWAGPYSPSSIHSASSEGLVPAKLISRPPMGMNPSWWAISGSNETDVLFKITCPQSSIIDVDVALKLVDDEGAVAGDYLTGLTLGKVYFGYLDGRTSGSLAPAGGVNFA